MKKVKLNEILDQLNSLITPECYNLWLQYLEIKQSTIEASKESNDDPRASIYCREIKNYHITLINSLVSYLEQSLEIIKGKFLIILKSSSLDFNKADIAFLIESSLFPIQKEAEEEWEQELIINLGRENQSLENNRTLGIKLLRNKDYQNKILTEICLDLQNRKNEAESFVSKVWRWFTKNIIMGVLSAFILVFGTALAGYVFHRITSQPHQHPPNQIINKKHFNNHKQPK